MTGEVSERLGSEPSGVATRRDEVLRHLSRQLVEADGVLPTLHEVVAFALEVVPCQWAAAAVMEDIGARPARLAATTDARVTDCVARIAADAGSSPGIEAFRTGRMTHAPDLRSDGRFGSYAAQIVATTPIRCVLSFPLSVRDEVLGVLTVYADEPGAFDEGAVERAGLLAEHAAIAVSASVANERADHLEQALVNSRTIGLALGVLVERYKITPDEAFRQLRVTSQHTNRKLADIAAELVDTGEFTPPSA